MDTMRIAMPRHQYIWIIFGVLALMQSTAAAWFDTGHEIIASITYDELTPAARNAANDLLKQHPRYQKDLLAELPEGFDPQRYAFMIAATWPDIVRRQNHPMHFVANHPAWHYINIPFVQPGFAGPTTQPAAQTAPGEPRNILEALDKATTELGNPSAAASDRAVWLCWILHLCGDLHQPIHAINFYSPQYPDGDQGGNLQLVLRMPNQLDSQINLHARMGPDAGRVPDASDDRLRCGGFAQRPAVHAREAQCSSEHPGFCELGEGEPCSGSKVLLPRWTDSERESERGADES